MNKQLYFQAAASAALLVDVVVGGLDEERPVGALQLPDGKLLARRHVEQTHLQNYKPFYKVPLCLRGNLPYKQHYVIYLKQH